jgi:plastocyanin
MTMTEHTTTSIPQPKSGVIRVANGVTEIRIGTVVEKMQYDVKQFSVKAGAKVRLTFFNPDNMPHNIVFVQPKSADKVGLAALQLGAKGFEKQFIPDSPEILASSKLVDHGKEEVIEFTVPEQPGDY